jgi:signal transduction histidine kinase
MFNSLRSRVSWGFILLAVTPLLVAGVILAERNFKAQGDQAIQTERQLVLRVASEIENFIQLRENELRLLANASDVISSPSQPYQSFLFELLISQNVYDEIFITDITGQETTRISRLNVVTGALANRAGEQVFKIPYETQEVYYGPVVFDELTGEPTMVISLPLLDVRGGTVSGVLIAEFRFRSIWNLISDLNIGGERSVYIVDRQDRIIAHRNPSIVLREQKFSVPFTNDIHAGFDGTQVVLVSENIQLGEQQFTVVSEVSLAETFALAQTMITITALILVVTLFFAAAFGLFAAHRIVTPIEQLAKTAETIAGGDFNLRAAVQSSDELGKLAQSFNNMTGQLVQSISTLDQKNRDLRIATNRIKEEARLKSEFMSTMSHELRTPLNAMIGFTGIMLQGMGGEFDEDAKHMIVRIESNSIRLKNLINEILDLAKIEAGRMDLVTAPFASHRLAQSWYAQMEALAHEKNLEFDLQIDPALPETLIGDSERITQIAINLLSNAFKFTEKGSVKLSVHKKLESWVLEVTDTGIGIPPHALNFIFDEFRQLDGSSKRVYGGSGLGLAIVRNLTQMMQGSVKVTSELGKGSTFTVTLPIVEQVAETEPALSIT